MREIGVAIAVSVLCCLSGFAQNNRSAVSLTGSDTASCTVPDPCRTFGVAMSKTNVGGEIVVLATAGYGPFTVDRSISLISPPAYHAAMAPTAGTAITISTPNVTVVLRNLYLNSLGASTGISITADNSIVHVENLTINGFVGNGIEATGNFPGTTQVFIKDSEIRGCGYGIYGFPLGGTLKLFVDRTRLEANQQEGIFLYASELVMRDSAVVGSSFSGIQADYAAKADVDRSVVAESGNYGFYAFGGQITVSNSLASRNETGFRVENVGSLAADHCVSSKNANGFLVTTGGTMSVSNSMATFNIGDGIAAIDPGSAYVSGNTVTYNGVGLHVTGAATMQSLGNNMVRANTTNVSGTVTTVAGN